MQVKQMAYSVLAVVVMSSFAATNASAVVINFDQNNGTIPGGTISYDGEGGTLTGSGIQFDSIRMAGETAPGANEPELSCMSCTLGFTTGANTAEGGADSDWKFASGGSIVLSGSAQDSAGNTIATGDLLTGTFTGTPTASQFDASPQNGLPPNSLFFNASGTDGKNSNLLTYFGLDPDTQFTFGNTEISLAQTTFNANGGFNGSATQADLANDSDIGGGTTPPPISEVPEPAELSIFGLGIALLLVGVYSRRRSHGDLWG